MKKVLYLGLLLNTSSVFSDSNSYEFFIWNAIINQFHHEKISKNAKSQSSIPNLFDPTNQPPEQTIPTIEKQIETLEQSIASLSARLNEILNLLRSTPSLPDDQIIELEIEYGHLGEKKISAGEQLALLKTCKCTE